MARLIGDLTAAGALDGTENVWVEQSGLPRRATTQNIADLSVDWTAATVGFATNVSSTSLEVTGVFQNSNDNGGSELQVRGNNQGDGYLFVGQSSLYGGGVAYRGDATSPKAMTGASADRVTYYNRNNGVDEEVFSYLYNSTSVRFRGAVDIAGALTLTTALDEAEGGTGLTSYTTGDLLYASGTNVLAKRGIGSAGQVLTVSGGVPTWADAATAQMKWKTADEIVNNSSTYQDDNHMTGFTLDADTYYTFDGFFDFTTTSTADLKVTFVFTNTPQNSRGVNLGPTGSSSQFTTFGFIPTGNIVMFVASGTRFQCHFRGFFRTNATTGGTMKIQWAQNTATVTDTTLHQGTHLLVTKMG